MNSAEQQDMFRDQTASGMSQASDSREPIVRLEVPGRIPSWNEILGMEHWARYKYKDQVQVAFLSALRACAADCSMKTTSARSILLTAADTLGCYRATAQAKRKLRRSKGRLIRASKSGSSSKSSDFDKVPF